jgi:hypothetical protein
MNHLMTTLTNMVTDPTSDCILEGAGLHGLLLGLLLATTGRCYQVGEEEVFGDGSCVEIYVGNLSYDMTEAQMRKEFERYGTVKSSRIITNRFNSKSKGYGFIEMPNRPEAEAAIKSLHDKDIFGRKLRINEAKNKSHE